MKANIKAKLVPMFDVAVLKAAKFLWLVMKVFDPRPLQTHFAARKPVQNIEVTHCFSLRGADAELSIARLSNMHIGSSTGEGRTGLVSRKGLIKIYNAENGKFLMIRAQGVPTIAGEKQLTKDSIALNYDAKKALGIPKNQETELKLFVGPANLGDQEFYHMYQDVDASSRTARALGWYLAIGGVVYGIFQMALSFLEAAVAALF